MSKKVVVSFLLMLFMFFGLAMGANIYKVGDSAGWTNTGKVDYKKWASSKHFQVGDYLLFEFDPRYDNVVRVLKDNFTACKASSPFGTPSTGQEWWPLDYEGYVYFISSVPGHCQAGEKMEVRVFSASPAAPSTSPAAPAPSTSPAASPIVPPPIPVLEPPTTNPLSPQGPSGSPSSGSVLLNSSFCLSMVLLAFSLYFVGYN